VSRLFATPVQSLESDERYTPKWVFDGLGITFDLDPCSPGEGMGDCVPAVRKLTKNDDGLACDWEGCVWVNPPFSNSAAFADKFIAHRNGVFLGPVANGRWAQDMLAAADLVWLCADFAFTHPTHAGKRSSMPLMFCAIGNGATIGLRRLATSGAHRGALMERVRTEFPCQ
jgi:hypothetical protein